MLITGLKNKLSTPFLIVFVNWFAILLENEPKKQNVLFETSQLQYKLVLIYSKCGFRFCNYRKMFVMN